MEYKKNSLTDNYKANMVMLVVSLVGLVVLSEIGVIPGLSGYKWADPVALSSFVLSYIFASKWFSPDLDIRVNRPGKGSFPFRFVIKTLSKSKRSLPAFIGRPLYLLGLSLEPFHFVINKIWNFIWTPFGQLFTHRGAVHWPIYGAQLRILWVFLIYWTVGTFVEFFTKIDVPLVSGTILSDAFGRKGLYSAIISSKPALFAWIAIMVSDVCHSSIDAWDSLKKGSKFVPPPMIAPRGLFYKLTGGLATGIFEWFSKRIWN